MKKDFSSIYMSAFILIVLAALYYTMMPQFTSNKDTSLVDFSATRAFEQVKAIAQKPHYVGSKNHEIVANYLQQELESLGLETTIHEGYTLSDWGNLVYSKNVLARIKGSSNSKALLLLSHYDSAPHSYSPGASDAGSGVATIIEGIRAFLYTKTPHKNDIIIMFSDGEELGLNGAALFVNQHKWAKDIGIVLNFEARGTSGPSYMLMETNAGNASLVKEFAEAKTTFPVSNSLMYSIYKMLPNDTDLTVFREQGNIQGYNFAFIDDHYNYHTTQDDTAHLDINTLAHQGTYLMPLLKHFSNTNLNKPVSQEDFVYFSLPYTFVYYPFSWTIPVVIGCFVMLVFFIFIGRAKHLLTFQDISKGFIPLFGSLLTAGLVTFLGWKLLLILYPQYNDLLNGFTYNGHEYIAAFVCLSMAITMAFYARFSSTKITMSHYVAPLTLWIIINGLLAVYLPGAGFLIVPVCFGLLVFGIFVLTQKSNKTVNLLLSIPALLIITPFIQMLPVGLGLKVLFGSAVLTALAVGILYFVFGTYAKKGIWAAGFLMVSVGFFAKAHYESGYEFGKAKSNSLLYVYDSDKKMAKWATYDSNLDSWTKTYLGNNPETASTLNELPLFSKYNSGFTYTTPAPVKKIAPPTVTFIYDRTIGAKRYLKIQIAPNRNVNRYDVFANEGMKIKNFIANGATALEHKKGNYERKGKKIVSYYVVNNAPLVLQFEIESGNKFDMELLESSFDLTTNPLFELAKRENWMMPTPFVLNDAVVIRQKIKPSPVVVVTPVKLKTPIGHSRYKKQSLQDSLTIK
ncbi:hypothetical protein FVB9288_03313 [Flavobacterium sp. CECT 9288]|uniref:M28 family peptidase n=1 Tax=Flavobacterium sp. CECT 9288 TaxID=2845819 RepID=UPI001E454653|nr:M28 family peptidase [Flavobacterium sp. CECT 9288]CAH0337545.1 hypothetical protein FVB9288_03313 [Flavobacterium sp. CECT 9288]